MRFAKRWFLGLLAIGSASVLFGEASAQSWPQRTVRVLVPLPTGTAVDVSAQTLRGEAGAEMEAAGDRGEHARRRRHPGREGIRRTTRRPHLVLLLRGSDHDQSGAVREATVRPRNRPRADSDLLGQRSRAGSFVPAGCSLARRSCQTCTLSREQAELGCNCGSPVLCFRGNSRRAPVSTSSTCRTAISIPHLQTSAKAEIDVASTALTQMLPHQQAGRLRFIAVINRVRSPLAPDVPTAAEAGYSDLTFDGVTGSFRAARYARRTSTQHCERRAGDRRRRRRQGEVGCDRHRGAWQHARGVCCCDRRAARQGRVDCGRDRNEACAIA